MIFTKLTKQFEGLSEVNMVITLESTRLELVMLILDNCKFARIINAEQSMIDESLIIIYLIL